MLQINYHIVANSKPDNLPSAELIVQSCRRAWASVANSTAHLTGIPLVDESQAQATCAWVKFGQSVSLPEAQTQHYVAQAVNGNVGAAVRVPSVYLAFECENWVFIVMEFIDGQGCHRADAHLVADAVRSLFAIRAPAHQTTPGPVGGGLICHDFFYDRESSVPYGSVDLLQRHINNVSAPLRLVYRPIHLY
jgi:hypothetical protein